MAETQPSTEEAVLARVMAAVNATAIALDVIWYGSSAEVRERPRPDTCDRPSGPMAFRFLLQPGMAAIRWLAAHLSRRRQGLASGAVR